MFPCATGDENYIGGAVETVEGIRLVKQHIPYVRTVLGISNVSFGLPAGAREVVNSVFLYHCTKAGLDLAIVNAEKLERFASIPERERKLAEDLLFNRRRRKFRTGLPHAALLAPRPLIGAHRRRNKKLRSTNFTSPRSPNIFVGRARGKKSAERICRWIRRLANYIIEGSKDGLVET